jgi:hypothetical protein
LAEEVRKYHIPDFSNWKNHAAFDPPTLCFGATGQHRQRLTEHLQAGLQAKG